MGKMVPTIIDGGNASANLSVYDTNSITPVAHKLYLLCMAWCGTDALTPPDPTSIVGCNLTWTKVDGEAYKTTGANRFAYGVWRAQGSAPTAGPITVTFPSLRAGWVWFVLEVDSTKMTGSDGADAIGQVTKNSTVDIDEGGTITTTTLAAPVNVLSSIPLVVLAVNNDIGIGGMNFPADWLQIGERDHAAPTELLTVAYNPAWTNSATATAAMGTNNNFAGIMAIELVNNIEKPGNFFFRS